MKIAEIFHSIQGEGGLAGAPSVFIRTSGCNLRCAWCDTPYASWTPEGEEMSVAQILESVERHRTRRVVATGGEPMIAPGIVELTEGLRAIGRHITIETAGTAFAPVACDLMSVSPKLANSTPVGDPHWEAPHERLRMQPDTIRRLMELCRDYQLKFVVVKPDDMGAIRHLVELLGADRDRVFLMPEGCDAATLRERAEWIVEIAKREGFRFSPRLHIGIYGNRRGV